MSQERKTDLDALVQELERTGSIEPAIDFNQALKKLDKLGPDRVTQRAVFTVLTLGALGTACAQPPRPEETPTPFPIVTETTGIPPSPTLEIKTLTPTEVVPSPIATKEPTATPTPEQVTPTPEPATPTPAEATPTPEPEEECVVESCEPYQEIALYHDFSDEQSFSRLVPGTNKTFIVADRRDGRMLIKVTEPSGAKWEAWADDNPGAYGPIGEAPSTPTPEKPPAAVCTEPYWKERTPDREIGVVIYFGNPKQLIEPERPYIMKYYRAYIGDPWYTRRDVRITSIDRENQLITFQLNDGTTRQRRYISDTIVIMEFHNKYQGLPETESVQYGGNLCDLEVGDAVSMLHPNEAESANPNPDLVNLFGVLIVQ